MRDYLCPSLSRLHKKFYHRVPLHSMMISASLGAHRNGTQSAITPLLTAVGPWLEISVYEIGSEGLKAGCINFHFNNGARVIPDINSLRLLREKEGTHGWGGGECAQKRERFCAA